MLLVYATTRAASDGWGAASTLALFAISATLIGAFVVIELRSPSPLLPHADLPQPLPHWRQRRDGDRRRGRLLGVLRARRSTCRTCSATRPSRPALAFLGFALTVVVTSNVAQAVVGALGVRATLTLRLLASALSVAWLTRLPLDANYVSDLLPAFVLGGAGMGLSFVPVTIASLTGVARSDAGVASGLVNTSRQIGGAIGIAAVSAVAATSTASYASPMPASRPRARSRSTTASRPRCTCSRDFSSSARRSRSRSSSRHPPPPQPRRPHPASPTSSLCASGLAARAAPFAVTVPSPVPRDRDGAIS